MVCMLVCWHGSTSIFMLGVRERSPPPPSKSPGGTGCNSANPGPKKKSQQASRDEVQYLDDVEDAVHALELLVRIEEAHPTLLNTKCAVLMQVLMALTGRAALGVRTPPQPSTPAAPPPPPAHGGVGSILEWEDGSSPLLPVKLARSAMSECGSSGGNDLSAALLPSLSSPSGGDEDDDTDGDGGDGDQEDDDEEDEEDEKDEEDVDRCYFCSTSSAREPGLEDAIDGEDGVPRACWCNTKHMVCWLSREDREEDLRKASARLTSDGGFYNGEYGTDVPASFDDSTGKQQRLLTYGASIPVLWSARQGQDERSRREVIPACMVDQIREAFPNTQRDWDIIKSVAGADWPEAREDWMPYAEEWEQQRREGTLGALA